MQSYYYTATTLHICLPGGRGYISTVFPLINALPPLRTLMGDNFREREVQNSLSALEPHSMDSLGH